MHHKGGLVLGIMALAVPAMCANGVLVWLAGRRGRTRILGIQPAGRAETVLLVGSTWGFAATLHTALTEAGESVHIGLSTSEQNQASGGGGADWLTVTGFRHEAKPSSRCTIRRLRRSSQTTGIAWRRWSMLKMMADSGVA